MPFVWFRCLKVLLIRNLILINYYLIYKERTCASFVVVQNDEKKQFYFSSFNPFNLHEIHRWKQVIHGILNKKVFSYNFWFSIIGTLFAPIFCSGQIMHFFGAIWDKFALNLVLI